MISRSVERGVVQGAIVGLLGSLAGSSLSMILLATWQRVAVNPDGTPLFVIATNPQLFVWAAAIATLTGLVAATTPAMRAARLDPVVAIRG